MKNYRQLGTTDGISPSLDITTLASEALGSKKKSHAYNILLLVMKAKKTCCFMTPKMLDAITICQLTSKKAFLPAASIIFVAASWPKAHASKTWMSQPSCHTWKIEMKSRTKKC